VQYCFWNAVAFEPEFLWKLEVVLWRCDGGEHANYLFVGARLMAAGTEGMAASPV